VRTIHELQKTVNKLACPSTEDLTTIRAGLLKISKHAPAAAINDGWRLVKSRLISLARSQQLAVQSSVLQMPLLLASIMQAQGILPEPEFRLLLRVRALLDEALLQKQILPQIAAALVDLNLGVSACCGMTMN
jgi:hypothetical protein